jgi:hypothetical protein
VTSAPPSPPTPFHLVHAPSLRFAYPAGEADVAGLLDLLGAVGASTDDATGARTGDGSAEVSTSPSRAHTFHSTGGAR